MRASSRNVKLVSQVCDGVKSVKNERSSTDQRRSTVIDTQEWRCADLNLTLLAPPKCEEHVRVLAEGRETLLVPPITSFEEMQMTLTKRCSVAVPTVVMVMMMGVLDFNNPPS